MSKLGLKSDGRTCLGLKTTLTLTAAMTLALAGPVLAQETFRLGALISLSGGGAPTGAGALAAYKLAVEDINEKGGILGRQVELIVADTNTNPTHALAEARRLVENEKVEALMGPITSQEVTPVLEVATKADLLHISTAASTVITPEIGPLHFSTSVTTLNQVLPAVEYARKTLGITKFGIISDNGGMSKAGAADVTAYLSNNGLEPVMAQEFEFNTRDVTPQLMALRGAGAEALIFFGSLGNDAAKFLENKLDIGWDAPVLGSLVLTNYAKGWVANIGAEAYENVYSGNFITMSWCKGDAVGSSDFAAFVAGAYKRVPDLDRLGGPAALPPYYIQPTIVAAAINGAGTAQGSVVADWIETNSDKITALIGDLAAAPDNHFLPSPDAIVTVRNPHLVREDGLLERADCPS